MSRSRHRRRARARAARAALQVALRAAVRTAPLAAAGGVLVAGAVAPRAAAAQPPQGLPRGLPRGGGQQTPAQRPPRAPGDTTTRDSVLVKLAEPDSTMAELLRRPGFTATRYQGDTVSFLARDRTLTLRGRPAAVQRDETLLVGSTVSYDDSAQVVTARADSARGATVVLRDPQQGSDVVVRGGIRYDLTERRGVVTGFNTAVTQGETWFVAGERGAIVSDTVVNGRRVFYARDGSVTSCNETTPHYHFEARDIKMVSKNILVIRPAVLYIGDVPVMWLPFIFSDARGGGRRSGILSPRFGVAELLRNNPNYRRQIENIGYYFDLGDLADATTWVDWRSQARSRDGDPGYVRFNAEGRYRILDRFLQGQLSSFYEVLGDGRKNYGATVRHEQSFNQNRRVSANLNYVQSTAIRQQNAFNVAQVLGTINSALNFSDRYGPASVSVGGTATQYSGRPQKDIRFPDVSVSSRTISVTPWLDWTPVFSLQNAQSFDIDQGIQFAQVFRPRPGGGVDSTTLRASRRNSSARFDTPLKIFDYNWANSFSYQEDVQDFPESRVVYRDITDSTTKETRVFPQTFRTTVDWNTSFSLPSLLQGSWNLTPSVGFQNVDSRAGLLVRTEQSGGRWVAQNKRPSFGLSASPTFYAFPPGFGPVERFRHSINPVISYSYSPRADVSNAFLQAIGARRQGYLGSLVQNAITLQLSTNLEAKLRRRAAPAGAAGDSAAARELPAGAVGAPDTARVAAGESARAGVVPGAGGSANALGDKVRVLSLNFTPLSYDFARADSTGRGFTNNTFGYTLRSDLLPGFDFSTQYSLFRGDPLSDTAVFKPYRTAINLSFSLDRNSSVFGAIARLFGRQIAPSNARTPGQGSVDEQPGGDPFFNQQTVAQQASGSFSRNSAFQIPTQEWRLSVNYTESRQRNDLTGPTVVLDPAQRCLPLLQQTGGQAAYEICRYNAQNAPLPGSLPQSTTLGGPIFITPPQRSVQANSSFHITQKWAAQWTTTYDIARSQFASNQVTLQRELHDWRAVFAFSQAPNGNFGFTFFISLKAEQDLKFNYARQNYPRLTR